MATIGLVFVAVLALLGGDGFVDFLNGIIAAFSGAFGG